MKILSEYKNPIIPKVSIILLDWTCRESFHMLDYLADQTVPREDYEIIWIEYYKRRSPEIAASLKKYQTAGRPPSVDKWIVMEMPGSVYYHKHLMYNIGIVASRGRILVICDSDTIVKPTFVESIIKAFEADCGIVLHLDEVRNIDRKYYPFNYPTIEEITAKGCINWVNGKTTGVLEKIDPIHVRNYGACMCALREDLIAIGGADEHIDYLGHICGPYELTFRLINKGKKEIWHEDEYLYHVWHPGTDGKGNYLGPHDGMNMSSTALDVLKNGRVFPLVENDAIKEIRSNGPRASSFEKLLPLTVSADKIKKWKHSPIKQYLSCSFLLPARSLLLKFRLLLNLIPLTGRQLLLKSKSNIGSKAMPKSASLKILMAFIFLKRMLKNNLYTIRTCHQVIRDLKCKGVKEVVFYGNGHLTGTLCMLAREHGIKVKGIFKQDAAIKGYSGKIVLNYFNGINDKIKILQGLGIQRSNIVRLQ